jgi:hypothetical protein
MDVLVGFALETQQTRGLRKKTPADGSDGNDWASAALVGSQYYVGDLIQ